MVELIKNKILLYYAYKRLALRIHINWEWRDATNISNKWQPKESHAYVRKMDFKLKLSKESDYTVIIHIHRGEETIQNLYVPNIRESIYIKQIATALKGEINISNNSE